MNDVERTTITRVLQTMDSANRSDLDRLIPLVYQELREVAERHVRREGASRTLGPTALVHEVYLRIAGGTPVPWENRAHFFGAMARAMREVLVDRARQRRAAKRGGALRRVTLDEGALPGTEREVEILELHQALERLASLSTRMSRIVELRFFGGLTLEEAALVVGVSRRTAAEDWAVARLWLSRELSPEEPL